MTNIDSLYDSTRPQDGAVITGQELRNLLKSVATSNAGTNQPGGYAILIGDVRFTTVDVSTNYKLDITINSVNAIIDLQTYAESNGYVTPANVVAAINAAFVTLGVVAYVYNDESYDSSAFVAIISPRTSGSPASITIAELTDGTDASQIILGLQGRGQGMPYTVTADSVPYGLSWLKTSNGDDDEIKLYMGAPARAIGLINLLSGTGTLNLSNYPYMRIKIFGSGGQTFGPLTINIQGASPSATTPTEIETAINNAFKVLVGWPDSNSGPASLVTRNGAGQYLQIVSGPVSGPYTGPSAAVELSGLDVGGPLGLNFLVDDAIMLTMGLPRGEAGKLFGRVPHNFYGSDFTDSYIRGIGSRSGAGIGPWGSSMETSANITASGVVDGEVRVAKDTGIPWIFRDGQFGFLGAGWRRAVPGYQYPISYSKFTESFTLKSTTDTFVPQPLYRGSHDFNLPWPYFNIDSNASLTGVVGDAVTLVDGRDFQWKFGNYTGGRNLNDSIPVYDNFPTSQYLLGRTREGSNWKTIDGNSPAITGTNNQRLRAYAGYAGTSLEGASSVSAIRSYCDGTGMTGSYALTASGTSFSFTIPGVAGSTPIKGLSVSIRVMSRDPSDPATITPTTVAAPYTYIAYDNGSGTLAGTGITSGTINYTTGDVTITFAASISSSLYKIFYTYHQSDLKVVCVDVRKDPNSELRGGGTGAEAGVIYGASTTGSAIDTGSGFVALVRDDGSAGIYSLASGTATLLQGFLVDPPLDTTWRTLRVLFQVQAGSPSAHAVHSIFWNGSSKSVDWIQKDYSAPEAGLTTSQTNGGLEVDRTSKLVQFLDYVATGNPNETGYYSGLWAKPTVSSGGYSAKHVQFRNFQDHSGHKTSFIQTVPALPPVSAVRLRDTINVVQLQHNSGNPSSGGQYITDCNAKDPMVINLIGDLANTDSVIDLDVSSNTARRLNLRFDTVTTLARKDQKYLRNILRIPSYPAYLGIPTVPGGDTCQMNRNGNYAVWDIASMLVYSPDYTTNPSFWVTHTSASGIARGSFRFPGVLDTAGASDPANTADPSVLSYGYWNPLTILPSTPYTPTPSDCGMPPWSRAKNNNYVFTVTTTLPRNGLDGIAWQYDITCAEVYHEFSPRLAGSSGPWTSASSGNWSISEKYQVPYISQVLYNDLGGDFASFDVYLSYYGPVRPTSFRLAMRATRRGTELN